MSDLFEAYCAGGEDLSPFFGSTLAGLWESPPPPCSITTGLLEEINAYQKSIGGTACLEGNEALVVTGQQPAIFTGPLYSVYKAATAVLLARALHKRHGFAARPVFWHGSEDHDFEEACTACFLTKQHEPLEIRYAPECDVTGLPMYRVPVEPSLHQHIDEAAKAVPGAEHRESTRRMLHETLDAAESLADWSARILAALFVDTELVHFAPHLPAARAAARPVYAAAFNAPERIAQITNEAGATLIQLGYHAQVEKQEEDCPFFLEVEGRRHKVVLRNGRFALPECKGVEFEQPALQDLLEHHPERFSPNVTLRPIVQQHLLQPTAYVAGPGEVAYWAQLKEVFGHFGLRMPVVYPRARCALTTIKLNKLLRETGLHLDELQDPREILIDRALHNQESNGVRDAFQSQREKLAAAAEDFEKDLAAHQNAAADMAKQLRMRIESALQGIERAIVHSDEQQKDAIVKRVDRLIAAFAPWRKPQERVYTVCSFLFTHGPGLIERLLNEMDIASFKMNEVEL